MTAYSVSGSRNNGSENDVLDTVLSFNQALNLMLRRQDFRLEECLEFHPYQSGNNAHSNRLLIYESPDGRALVVSISHNKHNVVVNSGFYGHQIEGDLLISQLSDLYRRHGLEVGD